MIGFSRTLFLVHRYLGIGLGLIITLWCLSGFVMMYVPYPELTLEEQNKAAAPLDFASCCSLPSLEEFSDIELSGAHIVSWPRGPILFLDEGFGTSYPIDLRTGEYLSEITPEIAQANASQFIRQMGVTSDLSFQSMLLRDQWTVTSFYDNHRPFYFYQVDDAKGSQIYVSSSTGEVVLETTRAERGWNWVGSVVHWIYPTALRTKPVVWFWTVVVLSGISLFLAVIGVYIGIRYLQFSKKGKLSPFRGWGLWHHYIGLIFGLLTMTWLFSGMLSMAPFSALEGRNLFAELAVVQGRTLFDQSLRDKLGRLNELQPDEEIVRIDLIPIAGQLSAQSYNGAGDAVRYDTGTWHKSALSEEYFQAISAAIKPNVRILNQGWMDREDAYYYKRRSAPPLPVYRVLYEDGERAYFDKISGDLLYLADTARQWNRWLFNGLHSLDFTVTLRQRPIWDILVWLTLGGITAGVITGTWMGWLRLTGRSKVSD